MNITNCGCFWRKFEISSAILHNHWCMKYQLMNRHALQNYDCLLSIVSKRVRSVENDKIRCLQDLDSKCNTPDGFNNDPSQNITCYKVADNDRATNSVLFSWYSETQYTLELLIWKYFTTRLASRLNIFCSLFRQIGLITV